jgi:UDP-N-acetylglucosamine--dolichyl-phosphate N-acetylglucosaminephosphotransferase
MAYGSTELVERHLFSLYFMLSLVGVCLGFFYHNWWVNIANSAPVLMYQTNRYPSRVSRVTGSAM